MGMVPFQTCESDATNKRLFPYPRNLAKRIFENDLRTTDGRQSMGIIYTMDDVREDFLRPLDFTMDLITTSLPNQFLDIQSPDRFSDHDIVSRTLKIVIPPIKKPRRKVYRYQKGDYESMRSDALRFAKERK